MHAKMWEPIEGICEPCDHIAFSYIPLHAAEICMTFAATAGGSPRELILRFKQVVVLSGEDEAPGGFVPAPATNSLPKLGRGAHPTWTFPLLEIVDSEPLRNFQLMRPHKIAHFFMLSMDNLVHVIASAEVDAAWNNSIRRGASA
jgi:hypothetical protein